MATKNYMINDKWLDLNKQNIVELQSVDGVLDSLKVNGSEIVTPSGKITITENGTDIDIAQYALADVNVEGGGGSSDFSTAEVTVGSGVSLHAPVVVNEQEFQGIVLIEEPMEDEMIWQVPLYKGKCMVNIYTSDEGQHISVSGNITEIDANIYYITGDCTITIS